MSRLSSLPKCVRAVSSCTLPSRSMATLCQSLSAKGACHPGHRCRGACCNPFAITSARRSYYGDACPTPIENAFDRQWRKLNTDDREKLREEYAPLDKVDWKQLTMEQKKALYTIAFDLPEEKDPNSAAKVFLGTAAVVGLAASIGLTLKALRPSSPTATQEHYEKTQDYLRVKNEGFINRD